MLGDEKKINTEYPTGDLETFLTEIQSPKQNMNISEAEGLEELETLQVTEKPEKEDLVMKSSVANASGKLLATVIDTSLPAALGFLAKEEGSGYKADEEDRAELEKALGEYMKLKGGDIPPGMMVLVLVLSIYGAKIPMAIQHRKMNVERLELEQQKKDLEARERALTERLRIADSKKDDTP